MPPPPPTLAHETPAPPRRSAGLTAPRSGAWLRRMLAFAGPGYLVAVGYMDPGNWATDLAGGSAFGYALLWVVLLASLMAMLLQVLAARLGIVTGLDLAQACRSYSHPRTVVWQWLLCEMAICACDLAEVIGTAIGLKLLFGIPLPWGVAITVADVLVILWLQRHGFRYLEALVISLFAIVLACFSVTLALAQPAWSEVGAGFLPSLHTVTDAARLYVAIGIIGATVMPHNLYLHSAAVQRRGVERSRPGKSEALAFAAIDVVIALTLALFVNAAILVTAGAVFHAHGYHQVAELQDAYRLIGPVTGTALAALLFGTALLASGQSSSVTATLAGQIIMEGFLQLKMPTWIRRLATRLLVVAPTLVVTLLYDDAGIARLLILSQVMLSLQLPFAMFPLLRFTSSKKIMGDFASGPAVAAVAWAMMAGVSALNLLLAWRTLSG
ncbi:MAG TPA: Nramp family divalent metal transporter [Janthinobacterium sp.]|nr:Nramp family divalent metal transporter [Janthinobacterium sp.]